MPGFSKLAVATAMLLGSAEALQQQSSIRDLMTENVDA
jgi:hypothetical protein